MKQKFAILLVNIVSVIDVLLIRLRNRKVQKVVNDTVLVRLDAIGDFIMWLDSAKEFKKRTTDRVVLICNQVCCDIAKATGYFDEIIGVDYSKLRRTSQAIYRWSMHKALKTVKANEAIQCTYSKEIFSDMVMSAVSAKEKITIDSPDAIRNKWTYKLASPIYQRVVTTPKEHMMEIHRNALFVGAVFGEKILSGVPNIKENKNEQKKVPEEKYYVLFLGASEPERMWSTERFVEVAEQLYVNKAYGKLKCCLCGGKSEAYLGDKFIKHYSIRDNVINVMGQTSLTELIEVIRGAEFIVTNDTSAVHFAAAVNTQAFCIWGPWEYGRFLPYEVDRKEERKLPIVCYHEMECRNCLLDGTDKTTECKKYIMEKGIRMCLDKVTVNDIMEKIRIEK